MKCISWKVLLLLLLHCIQHYSFQDDIDTAYLSQLSLTLSSNNNEGRKIYVYDWYVPINFIFIGVHVPPHSCTIIDTLSAQPHFSALHLLTCTAATLFYNLSLYLML